MSIITNKVVYRRRGEETPGTDHGLHEVEHARTVNIVGIKKQGSWLNWEVAPHKKLSRNDIFIRDPQRLEFLSSLMCCPPKPIWQHRATGMTQTANFVMDKPTKNRWKINKKT